MVSKYNEKRNNDGITSKKVRQNLGKDLAPNRYDAIRRKKLVEKYSRDLCLMRKGARFLQARCGTVLSNEVIETRISQLKNYSWYKKLRQKK